jgi:ribonuclease HII
LRTPLAGLRDSKKLTKRERERLDGEIRLHAVAYGLGWVAPDELDRVGLTKAVSLAMERALACIAVAYDEIIIDGSYNFLPGFADVKTLVKADDLVPAVSAASILAKVARDKYMAAATLKYPGYAFERHVGYGTAAHRAALKLQGICALHRRSFAPVRERLTWDAEPPAI